MEDDREGRERGRIVRRVLARFKKGGEGVVIVQRTSFCVLRNIVLAISEINS
jgi:hypothetical protein